MQRIFTASLIASLFGLLTACGSNEATKSPKLADTSSADPIEFDGVDAASVHTAESAREIRNAKPPCQTAAEIKAHLAVRRPESFCYHEVRNPKAALVSGAEIPAAQQLPKNLKVAFLNAKKDFFYATTSCEDLGAGWKATPHNKLDAVAAYFLGLNHTRYWSSYGWLERCIAWTVSFQKGMVTQTDMYSALDELGVLCLKNP